MEELVKLMETYRNKYNVERMNINISSNGYGECYSDYEREKTMLFEFDNIDELRKLLSE